MNARALALIAILAAGACKKATPPEVAPESVPAPLVTPALGAVIVADRTAEDERPRGFALDTMAMTEQARLQLAGAGVFAGVAADAGATPRARVEVDLGMESVEAEGKGLVRVAARLRIDVRPESLVDRSWNENVKAAAEARYVPVKSPKEPDPRGPVYAKVAARVVHDLLEEYLQRQRLRTADEATLVRLLNDSQGEFREQVAHACGERRVRAAVPALLGLLTQDDEPLRDAALGALVAMREQKAVHVLAESRSLRDEREMRKIIDAIGVLGGDEAVDYLRFVADAHDDEAVKTQAKAALDKLARRGK